MLNKVVANSSQRYINITMNVIDICLTVVMSSKNIF